jgi:hypothetical protein
MSEPEFRRIPVDDRPKQLRGQKASLCVSAGGTPLNVKGIYNCPISLLGQTTEHPFRIIKGLNEPVILGADFINKHLLLYDPKYKRVKWRHENDWAVSPIKTSTETVIPEYSSRLLRVKGDPGTANTEYAIAEISCPEEAYLAGGPGLVRLDEQGSSLVEVFNTGPEPVTLTRGQIIGQVDNLQGSQPLEFDADKVNRVAEAQWKQDRAGVSKIPVTEEFRQMCCLECPSTHMEDYCALLAKHRHIFSMNKNEIGFCSTFLHKLFMKTDEPVYVKQFKIPEAHHQYLQDQVKEWLRLGIIQPSRSRYNSPVFLVEKKDGSKRVVQDFRSLNANWINIP